MDKFKGVGVALVTPFNFDFSIDYPGLKKVLQHVNKGGVDYLVVMGTTAESQTLSHSEKIDVLRFIKKNNPKSLPIVYGLGGNNTTALIESFKSFDEKVDAFLSVSPAYNKPSQQGIIKHFETIADASNYPVILYNVPGRTSSNMEAKTTLELATHSNICGIKEASGSIIQCTEIAKNMPNDFLLISGDDMLTFPMMNNGACGVISVIANAFPGSFTKEIHAALNGEKNNKSVLESMNQFNDLIMLECNPSGVKSALKHLKICNSEVRLPLTKVSASLDNNILNFIKSYK